MPKRHGFLPKRHGNVFFLSVFLGEFTDAKQSNITIMTHLQYIEKFISEGKTENDYWAWSKLCGLKASTSYKDKTLCEKLGLESIESLTTYKMLNCEGFEKLDELNDYILEHCENPADLAASYLELMATYKDYEDKNDFIQANLSKFPKASFERWSDKNLMAQVSPSWFDAKGLALDVQAEVLTESFYIEVSIQDILDYVLNHKKGKYVNPQKQLIEKFRAKIEVICGFKLTENYIQHLAEIVTAIDEEKEQVLENVSDDLPF